MESSVLVPNRKEESEPIHAQQGSLIETGITHFPAPPLAAPTLPSLLGNRSAQRVLAPLVTQPKLTIGAPDDIYEKEADEVAEQVMSSRQPQAGGAGSDDDDGPNSSLKRKTDDNLLARKAMLRRIPIRTLQKTLGNRALTRLLQEQSPQPVTPELRRKCACGGEAKEEEECAECRRSRVALQRSSAGADTGAEAPLIVEHVLASPGQPLAESARRTLEPRFGHDFSAVRVHDDSQAAESASAVNALAYTAGNHIVFGPGQYTPGTKDGNRLLAHELTHTIQQTGGKPKPVPSAAPDESTPGVPESDLADNSQAGIESTFSGPENKSETPSEEKTLPGPATSPPGSTAEKRRALPSAIPPTAGQNGGGPEVQLGPALAAREGTAEGQPAPEANVRGFPPGGATFAENRPQVGAAGDRPEMPAASKPGGGGLVGGRAGSVPSAQVGGSGGPASAPVPQLDTSSPSALLQSLASASASSFSETLQSAQNSVPGVQAKEKSALESSLPEIERPTGLPRRSEPPKGAPTSVPKGSVPSAKGGGGARPSKPPDTKHEVAAGPLPGARVSTAVAEPPQQEEEGSWWSWLVNRVAGFVGSLPTSDPGLSTSAGPRPNVDLTGDADPHRNEQQEQLSAQSVGDSQTHADGATSAHFGEDDIYPTVPAEKLRSSHKPGPSPGSRHTAHKSSPALSSDLRAQFDQSQTPAMSAKVNEQLAKYRQEQIEHQKSSDKAREDGQKRIADESEKSKQQQKGLQQQAKAEVDGERSRWRQENLKVAQEYSAKSSQKRSEIDRQINEKVQTTDQTVSKTLSDAETKAEAERVKTEQQAEAKKREAEARPKSFWERVKGAISSVFDEIKAAVNGLFDALRSFVKKVIDEAKAVVRGLIDLARNAIVGLIEAFGEALKVLVTVALAAFPEIAEKARQWIDKKVASAVEAVNRAADELKKITDSILDAIGAALDAALAVLQTAFIVALDVLEFIAKAPFELMELLEKVMKFLDEYNPFFGGLDKLSHAEKEIEEGARTTLQGMIDKVPGEVESVIQKASKTFGKAAEKHISGIWRHLKPALEHLKAHWWDEIKQMVWNLVWPFNDKSPLWKDVPELLKLPGKILSSIWNGKLSEATDEFLLALQKVNSILGIFYGWFFIASVLVGTIIGAFFGGAGAIPGAIAGAGFAGEVGEGLLLAMVATETGVIAKAAYDLAFGPDTPEVNESSYDRIANSSLTLGITGVMMILGELAADLAKAIIDGVKGLFEGAGEAGPKVELPKGEEVPKGEEAPKVETPADADVVAKEPTADGQHEIEITKDGRCLICSTCEEVGIKYKQELDADPDVAKELEEAKTIEDPDAKAIEVKRIQEKLAKAREEAWKAETPEQKAQALKDLRTQAKASIEEIRKSLADPKNDAIWKADPAKKAEIEGKLRELDGEYDKVAKGSEGVEGAPDLQDLARGEFDDVRTKAELLKGEVKDILEPPEPGTVPRPGLGYPKNMLPNEGAKVYRSPDPTGKVVQSPEGGGYLDADGNVWTVDKTKARTGKFFEWDVQHPDGTHTNVGSDGNITHGPDNF